MEILIRLLQDHEDWLMERILSYAKRFDYTRYTSTLKEAWRLSITGLTDSIAATLNANPKIPDFGPDTDFRSDPLAQFGMLEAERHRRRGVSLGMFLGLMKYYHQSYLDLLLEKQPEGLDLEIGRRCLSRCFDRIEIAFCQEWAKPGEGDLIKELQTQSRMMVNEKNAYLTAFESLSHPVIMLDRELKVLNLNHAAAQLVDVRLVPGAAYYDSKDPEHMMAALKEHPVIGQSLHQVFPWLAELEESIPDLPHGWSGQFRYKSRDFQVQLANMLDVSEKFTALIITLHEITEQQRMLYALKNSCRQLEGANNELKLAQQQIIQSEKLASIGQLAAGVAHEMNTPVGFVASNFQTLNQYMSKFIQLVALYEELAQLVDAGDKEARLLKYQQINEFRKVMKIDFVRADIEELFKESSEGLERVTCIVQNLRDFSRVDQADSVMSFNLNDGIQTTLTVARNEIKYQADVITDLGDLPPIQCHAGQINQVLLNILVNAAQALAAQEREERGTITLRTYPEGDSVVCQISDNGPGINREVQQHIFDPFFTTNPVGKGTGLGLSVSYDIITHKHYGSLSVDSTPGQGTTFTIKLPLTPSESESTPTEPLNVD